MLLSKLKFNMRSCSSNKKQYLIRTRKQNGKSEFSGTFIRIR